MTKAFENKKFDSLGPAVILVLKCASLFFSSVTLTVVI